MGTAITKQRKTRGSGEGLCGPLLPFTNFSSLCFPLLRCQQLPQTSNSQIQYFAFQTCITSQVLCTLSPWMTLLNYFTTAKYKCLRKSPVDLSTSHATRTPPRKVSPSFFSSLSLLTQIPQKAMLKLWIDIPDHPETPCPSWLQLDL